MFEVNKCFSRISDEYHPWLREIYSKKARSFTAWTTAWETSKKQLQSYVASKPAAKPLALPFFYIYFLIWGLINFWAVRGHIKWVCDLFGFCFPTVIKTNCMIRTKRTYLNVWQRPSFYAVSACGFQPFFDKTLNIKRVNDEHVERLRKFTGKKNNLSWPNSSLPINQITQWNSMKKSVTTFNSYILNRNLFSSACYWG